MSRAVCPDCGAEFYGSDASAQYDTHMNQEHRPRPHPDNPFVLLESLRKVQNALEITSQDTMGRINMENRVIWTATGSWRGDQPITIGDLQALVRIIEIGREV